ncbi:MAG: endonuclease/exonuclease/phosphatase family protein [Bdellovibrionales bacterium]
MPAPKPNIFKVAQLNAENLFLYLDEGVKRDWARVPEKDWQALSHATVPNKPLGKTLWLAETIKDIDADLVFLNEVGGDESIRHFTHHFLEDRYRPYLVEGNSDRGIDVGYLVRKDLPYRIELRSHRDRPLGFRYPHETPEAKTHYLSRDCAELRLYTPGADRPFLIALCVHLKSKLDPEGIDPNGILRRQAEASLVAEIYSEIRQEFSPPIPVILAGDFNGNASRAGQAPEFAALHKTDLQSVMDILNREGEETATQLQFGRHSQIQGLQIDYVFISPDLREQLMSEGTEVFRYRSDLKVAMPLPSTLDERLKLPSDHYPVVASFNPWF